MMGIFRHSLIAFFWMSGLTLWISVVAFLIYFAIAVACTRMRAELGPPAHDLHNGGPDYILTAALGTRFFSDRDLTTLTLLLRFQPCLSQFSHARSARSVQDG